MKTKRILAAAAAAMILCASFTGCADRSDGGDTSSSRSSKSSSSKSKPSSDDKSGDKDDSNKDPDASGNSDTSGAEGSESSSSSAESKPAQTPADSKYGYYKLLDEEYKKMNPFHKNTIIVNHEDSKSGKYVTYIYDIAKKELKQIKPTFWGVDAFMGDKLYDFYNDSTIRLARVYDLNGELLLEKEIFEHFGNVYLNDIEIKDGLICWRGIVYDDMLNELPAFDFSVEIDVGHGKTETQKITPRKSKIVDGKVYCQGYYITPDKEMHYSYYCLDPAKGEWEEQGEDSVAERVITGDNILGKYYVSEDGKAVIDVTTGEETDIPVSFSAGSYRGGDGKISYNKADGTWVKTQQSPDGNNRTVIGKDENKTAGELREHDDKYYLVIDNYGIYMRTYEHGDDPAYEITVVEF